MIRLVVLICCPWLWFFAQTHPEYRAHRRHRKRNGHKRGSYQTRAWARRSSYWE